MTKRVGIYVRISVDRDGTSLAPERQVQDCTAVAEAKGWTVQEVYEERDVSAFKRNVKRPALEQLLEDLRTGAVDAVLVYKIDRLARSVMDFSLIMEELTSAGAVFASVTDPVDTSTPMGRAMLQIIAVFAELESATISQRVRRQQQQAREAGRWHAGGSRTFGYSRDGTIVPEEADLITEAARRFLAGDSLRGIAKDFAERDVLTSMGNHFTSGTLGQMLRSPVLGGYSEHGSKLYKGEWVPIFANETYYADLRAALANPRRRTTPGSRTKHLLPGLVYCGLCGHRLKTMGFRQKNGQPFERYQCHPDPGTGRCGKIAVTKNGLDKDIRERVLAALSTADADHLPSLANLATIRTAVQADEDAQERLAKSYFVDRTMNEETYQATSRTLSDRIAANQQAIAVATGGSHALAELPTEPAALAAWWEGAPNEDRRAVLSVLVERIDVQPAKTKGGNRYDPGRAAVTWR